MSAAQTTMSAPVVTDSSWQLSHIEELDINAHANRKEQTESDDSNPPHPFLPDSVSRFLKPAQNIHGVVSNNTSSQPGYNPSTQPSAELQLPHNAGTQHVLSHEFLKTDPAFNPAEISGHEPNSKANASRMSRLVHGNAKKATKGVAKSVLHPRRTIIRHYQGKTAKSLSNATQPYVTPQSDREFLAAYDALFEAEYERDSERARDETNREDVSVTNYELQRRKVELLEAHRQSLTVAWITGRHVKCIRLVQWPVPQCPSLNDENFIKRNEKGDDVGFRWDQYIGQTFLYFSQSFTARYIDDGASGLPFDPVTLVERVVMATEVWQAWLMDMRDIYRWENPRRTAFWYAVFAVLWYTQHIGGFLYAYIIFIVLKNRFYPTDVDSIRESLDRVLDRGAQAHRCGELVDRYGRKKWLEPLIQEAIPFIQIQLGDFAEILEVLRNFYHWRNPSKTAATLFFFTSCLLVTLFADMEFCMKIVWFILINTFFLCWPIASRYPRYRYLVSPIRWVFWDIPSHPEWAIRFLQKHEVLRKHEMCAHELSHGGSSDSIDVKEDEVQNEQFQDAVETPEQYTRLSEESNPKIRNPTCANSVAFAVYRHGHQGQLVVSSHGLKFVRKGYSLSGLRPTNKSHFVQQRYWSYSFSQLAQMTKRQSPLSSKLAGIDTALERLELEFLLGRDALTTEDNGDNRQPSTDETGLDMTYGEIRGVRTRIETLDLNGAERDEVFNLIVGWSKAQWQVLSAPSELAEETKKAKH
ncbi:hypothetical protein BGW36DRAFT_372015 [Talaromyces proteolyticus]|uniref:Uncharacterized protein n=1 Tax=Talaromyces proteolyticus TaxID=1131652 RepID=A0AAD4Q180_9EURO|nr:uncharacterized protein BGW36DRAFT_372015 [Talaromyces proteolyticus]KAH8702004.1 hypothetical protein BGW36DRAFT_372015 [Talaromyces proteolyticus]